MLLRAGSEMKGGSVAVAGITDHGPGVGVEKEDLLNGFVEAVLGADRQIVETSREKLHHALGPAAVVDSAAVIANFMQMVRIADATGTPLDDAFVVASAAVRAELGIDDKEIENLRKEGVIWKTRH